MRLATVCVELANFNNPFYAYEFYGELANLAEDARDGASRAPGMARGNGHDRKNPGPSLFQRLPTIISPWRERACSVLNLARQIQNFRIAGQSAVCCISGFTYRSLVRGEI